MSKTKSDAELKIEELGDELKKQFEVIGSDVKNQLLQDFDKVLTSDINGLRRILNKIVVAQNESILRQSRIDFEKSISDEFGGSAFGNVLSDRIVSGVFNHSEAGNSRSNEFRASAGQAFLEMGRAIARSHSRNG